jgi:predicted peroxiredoxin
MNTTDTTHPQSLVVLTSGKQDRGTRATLAFSWACTSLALGRSTALYLTMEGTLWAMRESSAGVRVEGFEPLQEYVEQFLLLGGELLVCAPCSEYYCSFDRAKLDGSLIEGCKVVGLSTVVGKISPGNTSVVTF